MSYVELGNTAFRGELRGATGFFKGRLTADAVNAVDTVNIAGGQITYATLAQAFNVSAPARDNNILTTVINIPDASAFVEIQAFGGSISRADIWVDGVLLEATSRGGAHLRTCPFSAMIQLSGGQHTVQLRAASGGVSPWSYIHVQYIRKTGA